MNFLKTTIGLIALAAMAQMTAAAPGEDFFVDPDSMSKIQQVVQASAKNVKPKRKHPRKPEPPLPPAARCPADAPEGRGTLAWDDLKNSYDNSAITDEKTFAKELPGKWIKVGEAKSRIRWGSYDPEGLHVDASGCHPDEGFGGWCDVSAVSRTGWIGTYELTSGPLGTPHYGIQLATFDRLHQAKGGNSSYPMEYREAGARYIVRGHTDSDGDSWIAGTRREIRIIAPKPGQPAITAVMEEATLDRRDERFDREQRPDAFAYFQYCKVSE